MCSGHHRARDSIVNRTKQYHSGVPEIDRDVPRKNYAISKANVISM